MRVLAVLVICLVVAGCRGGGGTTPVGGASSTPEVAEADAPRDFEGALAALTAYADEHRDAFGGMYIDPPGGRSVVMLFTRDLDVHAPTVERLAPGTRVRQVEHTEAELIEIVESFDFAALQKQGIEMMSAGVDVINNRVELEAKSNDPTAELRLEAIFGGLVDVTIHPLPGPWQNVAAGDGWRLLDADLGEHEEAYVVRAATDSDAYDALWRQLGFVGEPRAVDFEREVVVSFGHGIGSSCKEVRLDDVVIEGGVVLSVTSDPLAPRGCTADLAGAAVFLVALERNALPADGFVLRLGRDTGNYSDEVEVSLP